MKEPTLQQAKFVLQLYNRWRTMRKRCVPGTSRSRYHGDKGVIVCAEWQNFDNFYLWAIETGFQPELTLDRIDNAKGYSPDNCRWATYEVQNRNKTTAVLDEIKAGKIKWLLRTTDKSYAEIGRLFDVSRSVVAQIKYGNNWKTAKEIPTTNFCPKR